MFVIDPIVVQILTILLGLIGGKATVPIVNWLKKKTKAKGFYAELITVCIAVLLSILTILTTTTTFPSVMTPEYIVGLFTLILFTSQHMYRKLKEEGVTDNESTPVPE